EFVDLLLLAGRDATDLIEQRALQLVIRHLNTSLLTDISQNQTKADAALCQPLILSAGLFFGGLFVSERSTSLREVVIDLRPDVIELGLNQLGRSFELVSFVERVKQLALRLLAGNRAVLALDLTLYDFTKLLDTFEAKLLCDFVIDLKRRRLGNSLDLDIE